MYTQAAGRLSHMVGVALHDAARTIPEPSVHPYALSQTHRRLCSFTAHAIESPYTSCVILNADPFKRTRKGGWLSFVILLDDQLPGLRISVALNLCTSPTLSLACLTLPATHPGHVF